MVFTNVKKWKKYRLETILTLGYMQMQKNLWVKFLQFSSLKFPHLICHPYNDTSVTWRLLTLTPCVVDQTFSFDRSITQNLAWNFLIGKFLKFPFSLNNELSNTKTVISVIKKYRTTNSTSYGHKLIWKVQFKKIPKIRFICNVFLQSTTVKFANKTSKSYASQKDIQIDNN